MKTAHHFFITICAASGSGRMEIFMIIDSHLHFDLPAEEKERAVDKLMSDLKIAGVEKSCIIPSFHGKSVEYLYNNCEDIINSTRKTCKCLERYLNTFYIMIWLNPLLPIGFLKDFIKEYILNGPIKGVKLSTQMNATDIRLEPLLEFLEENDIPVLFHCWYKTVQKFRYESNPYDIACIAEKYPSLRVLVAHLTGCRFRGIQEIRKYTNLFIDTSGSQPEDGFLQYALDNLTADRILFGSDYSGRDIAVQLARIDSIDMSYEDRDKILCKNAVNFFEGGTKK